MLEVENRCASFAGVLGKGKYHFYEMRLNRQVKESYEKLLTNFRCFSIDTTVVLTRNRIPPKLSFLQPHALKRPKNQVGPLLAAAT
jgi:hypothetical protein